MATNHETLSHAMAMAQPHSPRERRIAELEERVERLAERHQHTDSMRQLAETIETIKKETDHVSVKSQINRKLLLRDIKTTLELHNIPTRRFKISVDN